MFEAGGVSGSTPIAGAPSTAAPTLKPTGQSINVIDPESGQTFGLDPAYLPEAIKRGFKVEGAEHAGIRKYLAENEGALGAGKVALRGLLDEATFGVADPLIDANRDPYELAKWRALKEAHPIANIGGRAVGFTGSLLYGGEFFDAASHAGGTAARLLGREALSGVEHVSARALAAEAAYRAPGIAAAEAKKIGSGAAAKILQSAADMGTQGLVLSSPRAMAQLITGDPERAAETWVWGAAGGAALGGAGGAVGHFAGGFGGTASKMLPEVAGEAAEAAPGKLQSFTGKVAEEQAFRSLASNHASLKKAARANDGADGGIRGIGRELLDSGLVRKVGEDGGEHADRVIAAFEESGGDIGKLHANLDALGRDNGLSASALAKKMRTEVLNPLKGKPGFEGVANKVEAYIDSFEAKAANGGAVGFSKDKLSFTRLHDVRASLDDLVYRNAGATPAEHIKELREIRRIIQKDLVEKGEAFAQKHGSEFAEPLKKANLRYQRLNAAVEAVEDFTKLRELTNRGLSPTDYGAAAMGLMSGSPIGAVLGLAHKVVREEGNGIAARILDRFSKGRGLVALEEAHAQHADQLAHIPQALAGMSAGRAVERTKTIAASALSQFLGIHANEKLDNDKALLAFADRLTEIVNDPARAADLAKDAIDPIAGDTPEIAATATTKMVGVASYLDQVRPKPPGVASPFEPPTQWTPNAAQMTDFRTRVKTALDPYSAIDALTNGSLNKAHIETLQAVAPRLYEEMVKRITEFGMSGKATPMPYAQRLRLSLLTGAPLDRSIAQIAGYQQAFAPSQQQKPGRAPNITAPEVSSVERLSAG